jgi:hypothetical protein
MSSEENRRRGRKGTDPEKKFCLVNLHTTQARCTLLQLRVKEKGV